jgi:hypothetical protein
MGLFLHENAIKKPRTVLPGVLLLEPCDFNGEQNVVLRPTQGR